jgi:tetratricopeptide (TPR) repeat protein
VVLAQVLLAAGLARGAEAPVGPDAAATGTGAEAEVAEHVALGHRLYQRGQYQEAIVEYRRAYELRAEPRFLYEIAESYRQLGAADQALFYFDRYLAGAPDAPDRDLVEDRMSELESLRARPAAPAPPLTLSPTPSGPELTKPRPQPESKPTSTWRRWWFWTAVGVAIAAGVTAAALSSRSDSSVPATDLGDKRFYP